MRKLLLAAWICACAAFGQDVDIPFQKFTLPNGLTVIVHEDHKAPIVAVNVWYHVGSKNELPGKTGFAHLFEHLMFGGSEHYKDRYIDAMEAVGATDLNGTTSEDRTNYFETVPVSALDNVLWMESDRMGYMVGAIDKATLDLQRGVVQNEKRQGENEPYGLVNERIEKDTYPSQHPYSWTVIGSMDDLNAASLEDVKAWFRTYYGPSNAVLSIAGDIDVKTAREKVEKYFGALPPGPPVARQRAWAAPMTGTHRAVMQDRVPQARIYQVWNMPEYGDEDSDALDQVSDILGMGQNSRLQKRLVREEQIATSVSAAVDPREIGGQFYITATVAPGVDPARVEKVLNEEREKFLKSGPTQEEVNRVRAQYLASFTRGVDRIGGFGGKSDVLAMSQVYLNDPAAYKIKLARVRGWTPARLQEAAKRWLGDGVYTLEVLPYGEPKQSSQDADRSKPPVPGQAPEPRMPSFTHATLSNGLKVVVAERHGLPVVNLSLVVDSGWSADGTAAPGTALLTSSLLAEGTPTRTAAQIHEQLAQLGSDYGAAPNVDSIMARLFTLKENLAASLDIYSDVVRNASFPNSEFERLRKQQISGIAREKAQPAALALRVMPRLIYGEGHPYSGPWTGSGTAESLAKLTREDIVKFHSTWFRPGNATLLVAGDTTLAEIRPLLEKAFGSWKAGQAPVKKVAAVAPPAKTVVYLMDRPGAQQSLILAGNAAPPRANPEEVPIRTMNAMLGGEFASRINLNLREDKHWSYGVQSFLTSARNQRPFLVQAPVQTDKTKESLQELQKELQGIRGARPVTADELDRMKTTMTLSLPGSQETTAQVMRSMEEIFQFGLPEDYYQTFTGKVRAVTLADISKAAGQVVDPAHMIWVVIGDRSKIEAGIRELGLGEVKLLDSDGKPE
jgi:zinc protease